LGGNYFSKNSASVGFTLIELLVVIAVVGVLAVGTITVINPVAQFQKANDSRRKSDIGQIQKALETYYQDVGSYPLISAQPDYRIEGLDSNPVNWGDPWTPYMGKLPADPNSLKRYVYISTGQTYYIYASLDRETVSLISLPSGTNCGSGEEIATCNYGVSTPNVSP
jgi:general secretion pathway protein G